jgi:hypothetical protein
MNHINYASLHAIQSNDIDFACECLLEGFGCDAIVEFIDFTSKIILILPSEMRK